jgi:hypothetical protein
MDSSWCRNSFAAAIAVLGLAGFGDAVIAAPVDEPPPSNQSTDSDAEKLVKELGSPAFAVREAAARNLRALGAEALPAIKDGKTSKDSEIATRCKEIDRQIREGMRQAFLDGKSNPFPLAWKRLSALVGDSAESRKLFAEILANERALADIELAAASPDRAHEVYLKALQRTKTATAEAYAKLRQLRGPSVARELDSKTRDGILLDAVSTAEVAVILLVGTFPLPPDKIETEETRDLFGVAFTVGVDASFKVPFRKLFVEWLNCRKDPFAMFIGMGVSLRRKISEVLPFARRVAAKKELPTLVLTQSLGVIGNFGTKDDLPLLLAYRNDARTPEPLKPLPPQARVAAPSTQVLYRIQDVAAAMALQIHGQDLESFGTDVVVHDNGKTPLRTLALFKSEEARTSFSKKAWEWLDQQAKPKP